MSESIVYKCFAATDKGCREYMEDFVCINRRGMVKCEVRVARCEVGNLRETVRGIRARNGVISEAASVRGQAALSAAQTGHQAKKQRLIASTQSGTADSGDTSYRQHTA